MYDIKLPVQSQSQRKQGERQAQPAAALCDPEPNPLQHIPRDSLRPLRIRRIQRVLAGEDVGLLGTQPLGPLEDLPKGIEGEVDWDPHVRRDERIDVKGTEDVEAVEKGDHGEENEGEPRRVRLEGGAEDEGAAIHTLGLEGGVEFDVGDGDGHPGEEIGDGDEVLEPLEDDVGARGAGHVREEGYRSRDGDAVVRDPPLGALQEDPWRLSVLCQCVKVPRSGEQKGVGGGGG